MPTYEYECKACSKQFETEQRITEPALKKCPKCGKMKLQRLIGTGNFILKGGGWYADLYSSPKPSAREGESSAPKKNEKKPKDNSDKKSSDQKSSDKKKT